MAGISSTHHVLVLNVKHLLINFLGGHATTEKCRTCKVATMAGISSTHHVLGIKHLLGQLWHSKRTVLLGSTGGERGEASEEEVETREWNQVDTELAQIGVELTREAKTASDTRHACRAQVVEIAICWGGQFECAEADVVQSFVVQAHALVGILNQLVNRESGIVWLHNCIGHFWGWHNRESKHDAIGVLLTNFGDQ